MRPFNPMEPVLLDSPYHPWGWYTYVTVGDLIPDGSTGVILHCYNPDEDVGRIGLWEDPGAWNPFFDVGFDRYHHCWCVIGVDGNKRFKSRTRLQLWLVGYTGPDVVFLPSGVLKGTVFNAWQTITCSEAPADATGLIFLEYNESGWELRGFGIQKHGSTDWRMRGISRGTCYGSVIGCDDQQRVDIYRGGSNDPFGWKQTYIKLIGYVKGVHFNTNAIDISMTQVGDWLHVATIGGTYRMPIIQVLTTATWFYGLRMSGTSENIYHKSDTMAFSVVNASPDKKIEGKISHLGVDFFLIGGDLIIIPTPTSVAANNIVETSAAINGVLTNDGNDDCDCGFEWGETAAYGTTTPTQSKTTGETFAQTISGLSPGTLYHFRAFATNSAGTAYGDDLTFTAKPGAPTNLVATAISDAQIDVSWTRGAGALSTVVRRKIGSYPTDVADGDEAYNGPSDAFSDTGLDPSTTYYYRAWGYTDPHYSDDYAEDFATTFIAPPAIVPPSVTTESANTISQPGATVNGVLNDDGGEACDCWFAYGVPGGTIYTTPLQTKSSGELFSQALTGLTPGTRYHFRAVARNSTGITYGANMYFVTESPPLREFPVVQQELLELLKK